MVGQIASLFRLRRICLAMTRYALASGGDARRHGDEVPWALRGLDRGLEPLGPDEEHRSISTRWVCYRKKMRRLEQGLQTRWSKLDQLPWLGSGLRSNRRSFMPPAVVVQVTQLRRLERRRETRLWRKCVAMTWRRIGCNDLNLSRVDLRVEMTAMRDMNPMWHA
jgi:hypothetical protein